MAPINLPDGTEVSEVILPDGSTASEVIAPDGSAVFSAIPDSVTNRPADDDSAPTQGEFGPEISLTSDWSSIAARLSTNSAGFTDAYLRNSNGNIVTSKDVSSLSSGDIVKFSGVDLKAGNNYAITLDGGGSDWTYGRLASPSFPYTGEDLDIVGRYADGSFDTTRLGSFNDIGNPNGVLD